MGLAAAASCWPPWSAPWRSCRRRRRASPRGPEDAFLSAQLVKARTAWLAPARSPTHSPGPSGPGVNTNSGETMKKRPLALAISGLVLGIGAGPATLRPDGRTVRRIGPVRGIQREFHAVQPNTNINVRVLSPGDDGDVLQENNSYADAEATNDNDTRQDIDQTQSSHSCGCSAGDLIQAAGQSAFSWQVLRPSEQRLLPAPVQLGRRRRAQPVEQLLGRRVVEEREQFGPVPRPDSGLTFSA